jgi:hypothetical protein
MASTSITTAFVKQYGATLDLLTQTIGGKFKGTHLEESIEGEEKYYDQLGSVIADEVTSRYADSPENDISHDRRRVVATAYDVGLMLDKFDKVQMLVNPESEYVQQQVTALMRKYDIEFLKGLFGTAQTGKTGSGTASLAAANKIAHNNEGLTIDKIAEAREIMETNGVDLSDPLNKPYLAVSPKALQDLLTNTTVASIDFNNIKSLVSGDMNTFFGFEIIKSNQLPFLNDGDDKDGTNHIANLSWGASDDLPVAASGGSTTAGKRACVAYTRSAVRQVTNPQIMTEISKRDDKRFNYYAYSCMRTGAVRMEEKKVVQIGVKESGANAG